MTNIKLCGIKTMQDIKIINEYMPEYIGFIFAPKSKRYITKQTAIQLKKALNANILAVGVFVNEDAETVTQLLNDNVIDIAQLHGDETEEYIKDLRNITQKPIIKAFKIENAQDIQKAQQSTADFVLLDSGKGGTGKVFDWSIIKDLDRPYFLAGGLNTDNIKTALLSLSPYAVDVSSGIETDGSKDADKVAEFVKIVRKHERKHEK